MAFAVAVTHPVPLGSMTPATSHSSSSVLGSLPLAFREPCHRRVVARVWAWWGLG